MKRRFEYKAVRLNSFAGDTVASSETDKLNAMTEDGWKVVTILSAHGYTTQVILERPVRKFWQRRRRALTKKSNTTSTGRQGNHIPARE